MRKIHWGKADQQKLITHILIYIYSLILTHVNDDKNTRYISKKFDLELTLVERPKMRPCLKV